MNEFELVTMVKNKPKSNIPQQYKEYKGDTLKNAIFKCFVFNQEKGNRKKNLGIVFDFNDIDLMKEMTIREIGYKVGIPDFVYNGIKPKPRSKSEFSFIMRFVNRELEDTIKQLRHTFDRLYGIRIYAVSVYWDDRVGREIRKFCVVPTDPNAVEQFVKHPQFSKNNLLLWQSRTFRTRKLVKTLERKLGTFGEQLDSVLSKIEKVMGESSKKKKKVAGFNGN